MIKIKNFIAQIVTNKNLKWVLIFLFVGGLFVGETYAAGSDMSSLDSVSFFMHLILSIASWGWIILANLAGKLMTNDIVYGSFLNLDASLWTLRNIMKNFANFALGFMVIYAVVRNIFSIGDSSADEWSPKKVIIKTLMAGVLIQMSWFLMGAVVDMSTIMTSAIGAFPSQFIASNDEFKSNINNNLQHLKKGKVTFDSSNSEELVKWEAKGNLVGDGDGSDSYNKILDTIMPSYDSVSGPLIFIGLSIFQFNDFDSYTTGISSNNKSAKNSITKRGDLFLSLGLNSIVLLFFSLMMFLIFILNLFRVIILWLVIPLLPIIILMKVFKIDPGGGSLDFLDIKKILTLIFKPVLMVGTLSLILVILVLIKNIITNDGGKEELSGNVFIESITNADNGLTTSSLSSEGIMEYTMVAKDGIADIIVYFFGLFLIYFLVKIVATSKTGIGFIDNAVEGSFNAFDGIMKNLPVVPIGGGVSIKSLTGGASMDNVISSMGMSDIQQSQELPDWFGLGKNIKAEDRTISSMINTYNNIKTADWKVFLKDQDQTMRDWSEQHNGETIDKTKLREAFDNAQENLKK